MLNAAAILLVIVTTIEIEGDEIPLVDALSPAEHEHLVCDMGSLYQINEDETRMVINDRGDEEIPIPVEYCFYLDGETGKQL